MAPWVNPKWKYQTDLNLWPTIVLTCSILVQNICEGALEKPGAFDPILSSWMGDDDKAKSESREPVAATYIGVSSMTTIFILPFVLVATTLTIILLRKYRNKFYFYIPRKHQFGCSDGDIAGKLHDAFVIYHHDDWKFVVNELVEKLEKEEPYYTLCLQDCESMPEAPLQHTPDTSRRTMVVLSKRFLASDQCMHEFRRAHAHAMAVRSNYLMVILLEDIDETNLDADLAFYMRTQSYTDFRDKHWFWERLRNKIPVTSLSQLWASSHKTWPTLTLIPTDCLGGKRAIWVHDVALPTDPDPYEELSDDACKG